MKKSRVLAALLTASMSVTLLAGCGGNSGESGESSDGVESIVFATPLVKTVDMERIEKALNEILEPKINVHVDIEGISMANYNNQIGLMQSGGEQLDVMGYIGTYSSWLSKNQMLAMNEYLDEYGADAKEVIGEEFLKSTTKDGSVYALPSLNGKAASMTIVIRQDLIDELSLPVDQLKQASSFEEYCENLDLITEMYAQIHEAHPELACIVPYSSNTLAFTDTMPFADRMNDDYGVLMPDDYETVTNVYETEEFKTLVGYAYDWNQNGYVLEDATTTQETGNTYLMNGRAASFFIKGEEGQEEQIETATGVDVSAIKILDPFITTTDVNSMGFAISATSEHPEAAMKFLNEMYTNPDVVNLLDWGIEGEDYQVMGDGTVDFPEGVDAQTTQYGLNMDYFFGNQFIAYIWGEGRDTTLMRRLEENNKTAQFSPAMGFSYDNSSVSNEIAAVSNVGAEYLPGLRCGTLNPDTEIDKFNEALYSAGLQNIIDEKQSQYDEWRAEQ